jgi:hydrogenase expression/formation protein HypC
MCLGVPGKIVEVYETNGLRMGKIDFGGVTREACLAYVPEPAQRRGSPRDPQFATGDR